jgi:hypothetical protein
LKPFSLLFWATACALLLCTLVLLYSFMLSPTTAYTTPHSVPPPVAEPTATPVPAGVDLQDALLLFDSTQPQVADNGFRRIVDYYGLTLATLDLAKTPLTDERLHNDAGAYYRVVFISANNLSPDLSAGELKVLATALEKQNLNLMIGEAHRENDATLQTLTTGEIVGSTKSAGASVSYHVSNMLPEITRQLSGIDITSTNTIPVYKLKMASDTPNTQSLIDVRDDSGKAYSLLSMFAHGAGHLFVSSDNPDPALSDSPIASNYYATNLPNHIYQMNRFAQIVPMMLFVRYAAGDEAWHQDHTYANLTLDDPALNSAQFNYTGIAAEAIAHNFSFSVAMPPVTYTKTEQLVTQLFTTRDDRLSVVQHGNNHDGYEFYKYATQPGDAYPARPIEDQEANIVEGLTRMEIFKSLTGVPYARTMIFPENIAPTDTLSLLKEYNFQGTINSQDYPVDGQRDTGWSSYMYPAELAYANFAVLGRTGPKSEPYPFDFFIGQPVLLYTHKDLFNTGINAFDPTADYINSLQGKVEWQSIDYIMKHLFVQKTNDDASIDVMFYTNDVVVTNETNAALTYHIKRAETQNVPITGVTLDGKAVKYAITDNVLQVDATIAAGASSELVVSYAPPGRDFSLSAADLTFEPAHSVISATVHNSGKTAGPVTVGFFNGAPKQNDLLAVSTIKRIEPGASASVSVTLTGTVPSNIAVAADPYNVIPETDETNNEAILSTGAAGPTPGKP